MVITNFRAYADSFIYFLWRHHFYTIETEEPIHLHAEKGNMECKYWLLVDEKDIKDEYNYNISPKDKQEIRKIIFQDFDTLIDV